ncbi:MAG TPA: sialidase family protein [Candidatus Limnocylindrales bacterium]|nr:sialidase family protein [Candidatus Limnocylindrales bacterium]
MRSSNLRRALAAAAVLALLPVPGVNAAKPGGTSIFGPPVYVSQGLAQQAAEPSIRVDAADPNGRIWIAAPAGIAPGSRSLPDSTESGDLVWYSDDGGKSWHFVTAPGRLTGPTIIGGGDSDVATGYDDEMYATGLTLANITLAASCDNGRTWVSNPISNIGTVEDRQWIDSYEDARRPSVGPDFVLDYGGVAERRMWFHQVTAPCVGGVPTAPVAGPRIDVSSAECVEGLLDPDCYQWPGNLAVDDATGDVYVTHNTFGNDANEDPTVPDDVIVTRVDGGARRAVTQADVHPAVAADARPDTFDSFTVVAVDRASNVYVVWSERRPELGRTDTMLAISQDRGVSWSAPRRVNTVRTTTFPWIVAGDAGRIDIVYYGTSAAGPSPEEVPADSTWRVYMAQSLNALDASPTFSERAASPIIHQGFICTSGTGCDAGTRDLLDYFQVDIDARGMANIAYTDNYNTPPDGSDPHQEWITFVKQTQGKGLLAP